MPPDQIIDEERERNWEGELSIPLAANQLAILAGQARHPAMPLYEMCHCYRISGPVQPDRFQSAFDRWIESNAVMRTVSTDHQWTGLTIRRQAMPSCELIDLRSVAHPNEAADSLISKRIERTFDPVVALYDSLLLQTGDSDFHWLMRVHHLLTDGHNSRLILQGVSEHYTSMDRSEPVPPKRTHQECVAIEEKTRNSESFQKHKDWWTARSKTPVASRFYGNRVSTMGPKHSRLLWSMSEEETESLEAAATTGPYRQLTLPMSFFNLFVTALSALLYRIEQTDTVRIGVATHGRTTPSDMETLGVFMQLLPFQVTLDGQETVTDLSKKISTETRSFLLHALPGSMAGHTAKSCDVAFNLLDFDVEDFAGMPSSATWLHNGWGDPNRKLAVSAYRDADSQRWKVLFDFNEATFPQADQQRFIEHFRSLLAKVVGNPSELVQAIDFLTEPEKCDDESPHRTAKSLQDDKRSDEVWGRFGEVAKQHGDRLAIDDGKQSMNYRGLHDTAARLAFSLEQAALQSNGRAGANRQAPVPLLCRRNLDAVVGMLGVLGAGRCFMPIDLDQPESRIETLIAESGSEVVVDASSEPVVVRRTVAAQSKPCPLTQNACYVLFTSGSTGQPKGVVVGHESILNLVDHFHELAPIDDGNASWWTTVGFDVSIYEIFSALLYGQKLCIPDAETSKLPISLLNWLKENQIQSAYLPPFLLNELLDFVKEDSDLPLRRLLVGVEPISLALLAQISGKLPGLKILNGYGPTETTVCATVAVVDPSDHGVDRAPIGRPVAGNAIRIVDRNDRRVPDGVAGELWVRGVGVAKGYFKRPDLTNQLFVKSEKRSDSPVWYRTGDLVRKRSDGQLEFLGRNDRQLKVRGYRIEPTEVENELRSHADVAWCLVDSISRTETREDVQLVVYVVLESHLKPAARWDELLRQSLRLRLPGYMVPTVWRQLDAIPLGPNGKLDRESLGNLAIQDQLTVCDNVVLPSNPMEADLVGIWSVVLGVETVSVVDNFFELGGDSMSAIQVASKAHQRGIQLKSTSLFDAPTIQQLAKLAQPLESQPLEFTPVNELERFGDFPLTPIQTWFFEQGMDRHGPWNQNVIWNIDPQTNLDQLEAAFEAVLQQHEIFGLRINATVGDDTETDPGSTGFVGSIGKPASPFHFLYRYDREKHLPPNSTLDSSNCPEQHEGIEPTIDEVTQRLNQSVEYRTGGAIQAAILKAKCGHLQLIVAAHHLCVDAISWQIIRDDLSTAYQGLSTPASLADELGRPSTSFRQWALSEHERANSIELMQEGEDYWLPLAKSLTGELPVDSKTPSPNLVRNACTEVFHVSGEDLGAIDVHTRIVASLSLAIADWTGQSEIEMDLESHGRHPGPNANDVSRTAGWFTHTYPMNFRTNPSATPSIQFAEIANQIAGVPKHGVGFGLLKHGCSEEFRRVELRACKTPAILFNYFGKQSTDQSADPFLDSESELALWRSPDLPRNHLWEINARWRDDRLEIHWTYSSAHHHKRTIVALGNECLKCIRAINVEAPPSSPTQNVDSRRTGPIPRSSSEKFSLAKLDATKIQTLASLLTQTESGKRDKAARESGRESGRER